MRVTILVLAALAASLGGVSAQTSPDTVRVIVPVEGGVLYYRAGPGRGVVFRKAQRDSLADARAEAEAAEAVLEAVTEARTLLAADSVAVARLDRVERAARQTRDRTRDRADRLADRRDETERFDRRDLAGRDEVRPVLVRPIRQPSERDPAAPVLVPVPVTPPRAGDPIAAPDPIDLPPIVTVEEVERAFLDTGLFRASRVPFEFGKATLLPEAERVLDAVGQALVRAPSLRVTVDGHTDSVSSDEFNLGLSQRRAASVREYLVGRFGIDPARLVARGFGEAQPIATNETDTGRALNRRVEFIVLDGAPLVPIE